MVARALIPWIQISEANQTLRLTPEKERYFVGPYVEHLEDKEGTYTIEDVAKPDISGRFNKNSSTALNLGAKSHAHWIRFSAAADAQALQRTWRLYFGWPDNLEHVRLYTPKTGAAGWRMEEVGRVRPNALAPRPGGPVGFLPLSRESRIVTVYLRVEGSYQKPIYLQVLTDEAHRSASRRQLVWFGVYYGVILAMILYNLILLVALRELHFLYYILYLFFMSLMFFGSNGFLTEFFHFDFYNAHTLISIALCMIYFFGILFAKIFLSTKKRTPFFNNILSSFMAVSFVLFIMVLFVDPAWMGPALNGLGIATPPVFILTAFICWRRGFGPARYFLMAFITLAGSTWIEALGYFNVLPHLPMTRYSGQIGSAVEVILLQLALADRIRTMSREQDRLHQSLHLAREVQQNLLPSELPRIEGLDIAGKSNYCDETGGDYYDFIMDRDGGRKLTAVIGDVSGHGIPSALLMATARSSLRQRASLPGDAADVITDVNRQLVRDVEESGQFMTLFYATIDPKERCIEWVRAGHDPAMLYDPNNDSFEELLGPGAALGVIEDMVYKKNTRRGLHEGCILFLCTDGVWEARDKNGDVFGKEPIYRTIRACSSMKANDILTSLLDSLNRFQEGMRPEDDITVVVIKIDD